jgi:hypothetical protein
MPQPINSISSDLINLLKDRYEISDSVNEQGKFTDDPAEMKVFSFDFTNSKGEDKGCVVLSLLDDSESSNSVKIYFGQELANSDADTKKEWYAFLQDIRQFSKTHLLGFDVRNINKSKITRRDVEKDLTLVREDLEPMFEGSFGPIDGTAKTSHQKLDGSSIKLVIKHTNKIDPHIKNGRSRRIQKIYLVNQNNERFLLPFKNLVAARAMARHIENGGTPYDNVGRDICQLVEEMTSLSKFYRTHKNIKFTNRQASYALESARERYLEIKKNLASLSTKGGYTKNSSLLTGNAGELDDDDEMFEDIFDGIEMDEDNQMALAHVMKAYRAHPKLDEEDDFEKWVAAANGQGLGQNVIMDDDKEDEELESKMHESRKVKKNKVYDATNFERSSVRPRKTTNFKDPDGRKNQFISMAESKNNRNNIIESKEDIIKTWKPVWAEFMTISRSLENRDNIQKQLKRLNFYIHRNAFPNEKVIAQQIEQIKEKIKADRFYQHDWLTEADVPSSAGWGSPLSFPTVSIGSKFRTNKEIDKHKNITGKLSPLSLLNCPEKDEDEMGKDLNRISDLAGIPRPINHKN